MRVWIYVALISSLAGLSGSPLQRPDGWRIRPDRPGVFSSEPVFVTMAPGWQITTGPSLIAYEPASLARGNYKLESEILLFPDGPNEGYGLFVGGTRLDSNDLLYTGFQLRKDGKFSIWVRTGSTTRDIVPWTSHPAIHPLNSGVEPVKNVLAIDVRSEEIVFLVNGRPVHIARRPTMAVDGNFGFRVHENMNVHPTKLSMQVSP